MRIHNIIGMFLMSFLFVFPSQSNAQSLEQKLKECSEITVSLIRLQCYDRITENPEVQTAKPIRERTGLLSRLGRSSEKPDDNKQEMDSETETVSNNDSSEV